ncbi:uncharacterized protein [Arachis hypogaea]|uniref:uncharacterized protein n=1 Tax=Arachis hypogaea TaxID=3818 RepID=UPI0010FC48D9|nr:uncharacterized protein LOC114924166 [Arachis hypogaea]QHO45700.1 Protein MEI2-like [Arachis hypogaea]
MCRGLPWAPRCRRQEQLVGSSSLVVFWFRTSPSPWTVVRWYASKMLFAAIDENHHGTYDLMYLPIDFKNKCNVGYAFINMVSPSHIIPFYEENFLSSNLNVLVNQMGLTQVICWRAQRVIGTRN